MQTGDRVIVPSYPSWNEAGDNIMVSDEKHMVGTLEKMMPLSTRQGPQGEEPMPGSDFHAWVVLDEPIGIQDVIQCKASQLVKMED